MKINDRIRMLRENRNMSQAELAERAGYSTRQMISRIEAGLVDLPLSKVEALAYALGVDPAYLAGYSEWQDNQDNALELSSLIDQVSRLDDVDRARIAERISVLLGAEKYHED